METGYHDGIIVGTALGASGEKKTEHVAIQVEVDEGGNKSRITAFLYCSPAAWPYTEDKLRGIGWDAPKAGYLFEQLNGEDSPLLGKPVRINVEAEEYNGKTRTKVAGIWGPGLERMTPQEATSFAARLRSKLLGGNAAPMGQDQRDPGPPPVDDSDTIPF